jgi:putative phosphotransacetylase
MPGSMSRSFVESTVREVVIRHLGLTCHPAGKVVPAPLVVNVSARHMHLSQHDLELLFGPGYKLTPMRPLYQEGQYAAEETVTLVGPQSRLISNLRILGPVRQQSQIELAFTDAFSLGMEDVPVRLSGEIAGTPGGYVIGPAGMLEMKEGIIRAATHVHMSPKEAEHYGVKHLDVIKLRVGGETGVTFERVHVRISPSFKLEVHMDTDEANACGLHLVREVELHKQTQQKGSDRIP